MVVPKVVGPFDCLARLESNPISIQLAALRVSPSLVGHATEEALITGWTERRKAEFRTGRTCARLALAQVGAPESAIGFDQDGAPQWPDGFVGSISHKRGFCVAGVASRVSTQGVGIDIDLDDADSVVADQIASPAEWAALGDIAHVCRAPASLLFAVKEAVFKCQFPQTRRYLTWLEVSVRLGAGTFAATIRDAEHVTVTGRFAAADGWVAAIAIF